MNNKILFYIDSMQKGGANRVMANLSTYFAQKGYQVVLVNDIMPSNIAPEYTIDDRIRRRFLCGNDGFPTKSNWKRIGKLRTILREEEPDAVVSFMGPPNIRMLLAAFGIKCRKIVSVRNDPYREYGSTWIHKVLAGYIFRLADGCVFQTVEASKYFPMSIRQRSVVIYNPVLGDFYQVRPSIEPHNIVTVGRLEEQKNHELLIKAFARIADSIPLDNLIIYGEGQLRPHLNEIIAQYKLTERVVLAGSQSDIPNLLCKAKCFVLSSDYEGMPNALMEAMAAGVPVVSTDCPCGGPRTLIQNKEQGILVPVGNEILLSEAIFTILDNPTLHDRMSVEVRKRAEDFKPEKVFAMWEEYLLKNNV